MRRRHPQSPNEASNESSKQSRTSAFGLNFNLVEQLSFYGAYHNNFWNQIIHVIFVPNIVMTVMVFLDYAPSIHTYVPHFPEVPGSMSRYLILNNGLWVVLVYMLYYLALEPIAGLTWALTHGIYCYAASTALVLNMENAWTYALALHLFSWYMQIHPGHALLEKRKPALLDSLVQAFALAPLFVHVEMLFWCGYRPGLRESVKKEVECTIARFNANLLNEPQATYNNGVRR